MDGEIVRLKASDYDEALDFLNLVFSMAGRPHDFHAMLPILWHRDDEHVGKHFAIRRDGKIRAMVGVYPLPAVIAGRDLLFSTMGNVATHPYDTGKGYMTTLLNYCHEELAREGMDASRLGGLRQRYNRYGFEPAGLLYNFRLTKHNLIRVPRENKQIRFVPLTADDALLDQARSLLEAGGMWIRRPGRLGFYQTLCAWRSVPYAALDESGKMIGYLTAPGDGQTLNEQHAVSPQALLDILAAWIELRSLDVVNFALQPWQVQEIRQSAIYCEGYSVSSPSSFYIRSWDKVLEALLALKLSYTALPEGDAVVGIEGYGAIKLSVHGGEARCVRTQETPALTLDPLSATRVFMGPLEPSATVPLTGELAMLLNAWLPLPLSWNTLDRV